MKASLLSFKGSSRRFAATLVLVTIAVGARWAGGPLGPGAPRLLASGGHECDDMDCITFFDQDLVLSPGDQSLFLFQNGFTSPKDVQAVNLEEWSAYFGDAIPRHWLSSVVYSLSEKEVLDLAASIEGKSPGVVEAFARYSRPDRLVRSLEYLALAKRVEPIATRTGGDRWSVQAAEPVDPASVEDLITTAGGRASRADKFLAQRYRFQALRLMFYSGQYGRAQQYYERHKGTFTEENSPKYRFTDIAAGSYYREKKYGKANYLYSRVFDKFEPLRWSAYFSFHPMEEKDWKETLSLARNAGEREALWHLLGIYADGIAAIDEIYKMNPKSKALPYLLAREVNKAERVWSGNQNRRINGVGDGNGPGPDAVVVGASRVAKIQAIADSGKAVKPHLWRLAAGHLLTLTGDLRAAEKYIDLAEKSTEIDSQFRAQIRMSRLFARVRALQSIDKTAEPYLAKEHEWLSSVSSRRAKNLITWTLQHLSEVYAKDGDSTRALMLMDSPNSQIYQTISGIDSMLAFMRTPPANDFDRFLVNRSTYSVEDLQELRALSFLYDGNLAGAVEAFNLTESAARQELRADPFTSRIRDCHQCDADDPHTVYTKGGFAQKMLELSSAARGQGEAAAAASFELANGFYNMSYFGNGRAIYRTRNNNFHPYGPKTTAMELAEKYYVQSANLSSNKEFKAKAVFMAAKTEQNQLQGPPQKYFGMLKSSYADTQYYQEIIQECVRFKSYLGL